MMTPYAIAARQLCVSATGEEALLGTHLRSIETRLRAKVRFDYPQLLSASEELVQEALYRFIRAVSKGSVDCKGRSDLYLLTVLDSVCRSSRPSLPAGEADLEGMSSEEDLVGDVVGRVAALELVREGMAAARAAGDATAVAVLQSWKDAAQRHRDPTFAEVRQQAGRSEPTIRAVLRAFRAWAEGGKTRWERSW